MRRTIYLLILLAVTGAIWIADAQSERRERSRDRDRNGSERFRDRERERSRELIDRNSERRVEVSTNAAPAAIEREITPVVETVSTNSGPVDPMSYDAFRIIAQRNIFDPNRRARTGSTEAPPPDRPKRSEAFTLLGAINYEKGDFAFFDGTSSEYKKSVKPGDSIGGLKIAEVSPNQVTFEAGEGKRLELPIGSQMKRVEGEEWKVNAQVESFSSSTSSNSGSAPAASGAESTPSAGNGEASEVLKRLLERAKKGE